MSTVCWDGQTLAADRRGIQGNAIHTVSKVTKIELNDLQMLVGWAGVMALALEVVDWLRHSRLEPEKFPSFQRNTDTPVSLLVISKTLTGSPEIYRYENSPFPIRYYDTIAAIGSGGEYAIGAMLSGKTAEQAVQIAALRDCATGNGTQTLRFDTLH